MRRAKKLLVAIALGVACTTLLPTAAQAHFLGKDSVDGREIRYNDSTVNDDARNWAISSWNAND